MSGRPFKARFAGRCANEACRLGGIAEGDVVVYTSDDDLVHKDCDTGDDMTALDAPRLPGKCPACNLFHSGECF